MGSEIRTTQASKCSGRCKDCGKEVVKLRKLRCYVCYLKRRAIVINSPCISCKKRSACFEKTLLCRYCNDYCKRNKIPRVRVNDKFSEISGKICNLYAFNSIKRIAEEFNISDHSVTQILKKNSIDIRSQDECLKLTINRTVTNHKINDMKEMVLNRNSLPIDCKKNLNELFQLIFSELLEANK